EPKATGVRAMLPHVDDFRPVHNLQSLDMLARALGQGGRGKGGAYERYR
ncbi:MAG: VWA domain-containing protein, partial [Alphaproteobacteria bacterium]|nr:VWA domain-containing protein [Alphaproteobacteria bacterium]